MRTTTAAAISTAVAAFMVTGCSQAKGLASCEDEIKATNRFLVQNGTVRLNNVADLAKTLRQIDRTGKLPTKYITIDDAKRLGWSGRDSETLWGLKPTNQKWIGGDVYRNGSLPARVQWYSADLDVEGGYRSSKRLIYSPQSRQRFVSPDRYQHFVELERCK